MSWWPSSLTICRCIDKRKFSAEPVWQSPVRPWRNGLAPAGVQLQPLVDALREAVLEHGVIHADETR